MITLSLQSIYYIFVIASTVIGASYKLGYENADTQTAKARWVLMYIHFQIYSKAYKTNEFP